MSFKIHLIHLIKIKMSNAKFQILHLTFHISELDILLGELKIR